MMKKIAKMLILFALAGFAACTNDTTEDQVVAPDFVEEGSVKTLTLALDGQTRIELGEKTAEGKYPVYWQEGDVLRVNEGKTSAITIHENKSVADFTFAVADADAYSVVYPYVEGLEATTEGCLPVKFAPVQSYTEGSFDASSFPMYGYADGEGLASASLSYLGGIFKFEIQGNGEVLTKVELTASKGALSGAFDVNCLTGEMTAQATASKMLVYQLPAEGLELSETPTVLYIAVPAGDFGEVSAFFSTNDASVAMKAKMSCEGEKAVKAGVVREFKGVLFKDNADNTVDEMFEISDENSLLEFAEMCKTGTFNYAGAEVTHSFAVTSDGFESIENFSGLFEGNNNTLRELKVPLFGTTCGTIQNVKILTQVELNENLVYGAVAAQLAAIDGQQGCVKNCSLVEGSSITINRTSAVKLLYSNLANLIGGIVGISYGGLITDCTNYADITISGLGTHTSEFQSGIGGIVGGVVEDHSYLTSLGITDAVIKDPIYGVVANSTNYGTITMSADISGATLRLAGVAGFINATDVTKCSNKGDVSLRGMKGYQINAGGVVGFASGTSLVSKDIADCTNSGSVTVDDKTVATRTIYIGGVVAYATTSDASTGLKWTIRRCVNTGTMLSNGEINGYAHWIGGICGASTCHIIDCVNGVEGNPEIGTVTIGGNMVSVNDGVKFGSAGIVGYGHNASTLTGCTNHAKVAITGITNVSHGVCIGGIIGYHGQTMADTDIRDLVNNGPIVVDWSGKKVPQIGGIFGQVRSPFTNVVNNGSVTFNYSGDNSQVYMGGIAGQITNSCVASQSENKGEVTVNVADSATINDILLGGLVGLGGASVDTAIEGCRNSGAVTINGASGMTSKRIFAAGISAMHRGWIRPAASGTYTDTINTGAVTVNDATITGTTTNVDLTGCICAAGIVAFADYDADITLLNGFRNEGDVKIVNSKTVNHAYAAGCVAYSEMPLTGDVTLASTENTTYRTNTGAVSVTGNTKQCRIGGVCAYSLHSISGMVNSGAISANVTATGSLFIAGCVAHSETNDHAHSHLYNYAGGDITANGNLYHLVAGGCVGRMATCTALSDCHNYADKITLEFAQTSAQVNYAGGVAGHFNKTEVTGVSNISSRADISIKQLDADGLGAYRVGGVIGDSQATLVNAKITSEGSITIDGGLKYILCGGVAGYLKTVISGTTEIHNEGAKIWIKPTASISTFLSHPGDNYSLKTSSLGGVIGTLTKVDNTKDAKVTNVTNAGEILFEPKTGNATVIGGVFGWAQHDHTGVANTGDITISGKYQGNLYVGGAQGVNVDSDSDSLAGYTNSGAVNCSANITGDIRMGGLMGYSVGVSRGTNTGNIRFDGEATGVVYIGGACGGTGSSTQGAHQNSGNVTFAGKVGTKLGIGGIVGAYTLSYSTAAVNTGVVSVTRDAEIGTNAYVGGCVGFVNTSAASTFTTISNQANVIFEGSVAGNTYIGGVVGSATARSGTSTGGVTTYVTCEMSNLVLGSTDKTPLIRYAGTTTGDLYFGTIVGLNDGADNSTTHVNMGAGMIAGDIEGDTYGGPDSVYGEVGDPAAVPADVVNDITQS